MLATTLREAIEQYILFHDLAAETVCWYRRIGSVFRSYSGGDVLLAEFDGAAISRLLLAKKAAGRSTHYIKSLRSGLVALLREIRGDGPVERVR